MNLRGPLLTWCHEEDESSSNEELVTDQDILQMRTNFIQMQRGLRYNCNFYRREPRVDVWRRDAWLLEQRSIFDICNPEILWTMRSNFKHFKHSMGDTYELIDQPYAYANGYADCEIFQQANLLADRFATLRAILYQRATHNWNMPFLQDASREVAAILLTIAQRVIPAFFTMTPEQIRNHIDYENLFEFDASTNKYRLKSEETLKEQGKTFSDFEGQRLLYLTNEQEEMRDEYSISQVLEDYLRHLRNGQIRNDILQL